MKSMVDKKAIVLLIEGNSLKVDAMSSAIRTAANSDIRLETAQQLSHGLKRLSEGGIDLVLLDLPLKGLSDVEALLQVKETAESVPVLIVGGSEDELLAHEASRQGVPVWEFNGKGNPEALVKSIRHTIALSQAQNELAQVSSKLQEAQARLEKLAQVDSLTDILNRAGIERILVDEYNRAQRGGYPLIAIMIDCDDFDRINQSLGHRVGDVVLKE